MASIKVKFRSSTNENKERTNYYQVIQKRLSNKSYNMGIASVRHTSNGSKIVKIRFVRQPLVLLMNFLISELVWRKSCHFSEESAHIGSIFEIQFIGNILYRKVGILQISL